jgi:protein-L-isoaspartate(D-aspartate) O-methyltransferase
LAPGARGKIPAMRPAERLVAELSGAIADERVLAAIAAVPRELFLPRQLRSRAYENVALPIGSGQTISQPLVVARMAELLRLQPTDRVLDVGTGSGYHAAVLAQLAAHVWTVERLPELSEQAAEHLGAAGVGNVTVVVGDGSRGLPEEAPFDAINVAAAAWPEIPPALERQLAAGGRLVAPVGASGQQLVLVERGRNGDGGGEGEVRRTTHDPVRFVPLIEG